MITNNSAIGEHTLGRVRGGSVAWYRIGWHSSWRCWGHRLIHALLGGLRPAVRLKWC